jgi:hypothetical protein
MVLSAICNLNQNTGAPAACGLIPKMRMQTSESSLRPCRLVVTGCEQLNMVADAVVMSLANGIESVLQVHLHSLPQL